MAQFTDEDIEEILSKIRDNSEDVAGLAELSASTDGTRLLAVEDNKLYGMPVDALSLSDYLTKAAAEEEYQPKLLTWGNGGDNDYFRLMEIVTLGTLTLAKNVGEVESVGTIGTVGRTDYIENIGTIGTVSCLSDVERVSYVGTVGEMSLIGTIRQIDYVGTIDRISQLGTMGYNTLGVSAGTLALETMYSLTWNDKTLATLDDVPSLSDYLTKAAAEEAYQKKLMYYKESSDNEGMIAFDSGSFTAIVGACLQGAVLECYKDNDMSVDHMLVVDTNGAYYDGAEIATANDIKALQERVTALEEKIG